MKKIMTLALAGLILGGCATTVKEHERTEHPRDPWESYNRSVFQFNRKIDAILWKPLAKGYEAVVPTVVQTGVANFFTNITYPIDIANLLLQGEPADAGKALGRFAINSTIGVLGVFDVASHWEIPKYEEDFGQTLAVWGWEDSPYLVLPVLGGAALTQTIGYLPDYYFNVAWRSIEEDELRYSLSFLNIVRLRSTLLAQEESIEQAFDKYALYRDSYLQRRQYLIENGETDLPDYQSLLESGMD